MPGHCEPPHFQLDWICCHCDMASHCGECWSHGRCDGGSIPPTAISKLRQICSPHICLCLSEEKLKAGGPFYLVSMPGEVKDPTRGKCVTCSGLTSSREGQYLHQTKWAIWRKSPETWTFTTCSTVLSQVSTKLLLTYTWAVGTAVLDCTVAWSCSSLDARCDSSCSTCWAHLMTSFCKKRMVCVK